MVDGFYEFLVLIKDFVLSVLEGLSILVQSLGIIIQYGFGGSTFSWAPSLIGYIMPLALLLIIIFRIIGR